MEHQPLFAHRRRVLKLPIKTSTYSLSKQRATDSASEIFQKQNQQPQKFVTPNKKANRLTFRQNSCKQRHNTVDLYEIINKTNNSNKNCSHITYSIDTLLQRIQSLKSQFNQTKYSGNIKTNVFTIPYNQEKIIEQKQIKYQTPKLKSKYCSQTHKSKYQQQKSIDIFPPMLQPIQFRYKAQSLNAIFPILNESRLNYIDRSQKLSMSHFQLGKKIGQGKYGDVFICRHKKSQSVYALKKIMKSTIKQYNMVDQFINELKIHYLLIHPNIINLYTHFQDEYHVFLLMEYAEGGSLIKLLKKTQNFVAETIGQVLSALQFMHAKNISHRDLKPQNIVVFFNNSVKICDFGWSKIFDNQMKMSRTLCGTPDYISPQMKDQGIYGVSVDLWSIGVLTFELLLGYPPFQKQIKQWVRNGTKQSHKWQWNNIIYPPQLRSESKKFIQSLLKQNPQQRLSIKQCFQHPFIKFRKNEAQYATIVDKYLIQH